MDLQNGRRDHFLTRVMMGSCLLWKKRGEVIRVEAQSDSNIQLGIIEDFIAQDVDCVFYNPVDAEASGPALMLLKEAGIPVVNFDLAVANTDDVDAFVATDHYSAGVVAGEHMIKDYPEGGKIAILDRTNDNAASQRIEGLLDTVGEKFEVVSRLDGGGKPETGLSITEDILQANPDLVAIYCINDECAQVHILRLQHLEKILEFIVRMVVQKRKRQ